MVLSPFVLLGHIRRSLAPSVVVAYHRLWVSFYVHFLRKEKVRGLSHKKIRRFGAHRLQGGVKFLAAPCRKKSAGVGLASYTRCKAFDSVRYARASQYYEEKPTQASSFKNFTTAMLTRRYGARGKIKRCSAIYGHFVIAARGFA
jgi:hypothetical protein